MSTLQYRPLDVYQHLKALEANGRLEPATVVQAAHHPDHPLHDHFEWDDSVAAHQWRLVQARNLITSIRVIERLSPTETVKFTAWVHDPEAAPQEQGYREVVAVRQSRPYSERALLNELDRIEANVRRSSDISSAMSEELKQRVGQSFDVILIEVDRVRSTLA